MMVALVERLNFDGVGNRPNSYINSNLTHMINYIYHKNIFVDIDSTKMDNSNRHVNRWLSALCKKCKTAVGRRKIIV